VVSAVRIPALIEPMDIQFALSLGVLLPAGLALFKLKNIDNQYYWFVAFLWTGLLFELANRFFIWRFGNNTIPWNVYNILEFLILMQMFRIWNIGEKFRKWFGWFMAGSFVLWMGELLFIGSIHRFNSYFAIYYCFMVVIAAVTALNQLIVTEKRNMLRNPKFIISIGLLIFFTFRIFVESILMPILRISPEFNQRIFGIQIYINLLVNLIYLIAVICIPKKRTFTNL